MDITKRVHLTISTFRRIGKPTEQALKQICARYNVREEYIRKVAGWIDRDFDNTKRVNNVTNRDYR